MLTVMEVSMDFNSETKTKDIALGESRSQASARGRRARLLLRRR
jgi:hypothetical protein